MCHAPSLTAIKTNYLIFCNTEFLNPNYPLQLLNGARSFGFCFENCSLLKGQQQSVSKLSHRLDPKQFTERKTTQNFFLLYLLAEDKQQNFTAGKLRWNFVWSFLSLPLLRFFSSWPKKFLLFFLSRRRRKKSAGS